jgi:MoaA/NifB/PqqE/SkfB family radical SAM enzyme
VLDQALATLAHDGNLKFYGGEPTLHTPEIVDAIRYCRDRGFTGLVTVFSNGVQAEKLIAILESDERTEAVLNYSIFHGRDAEPLPAAAKTRLEAWAAARPGRLFKGYKVLFHAGGGAAEEFDRDREAEYHGMSTGCVRCFPVLTTKGRFHACPFAAEIDAPHFDLGGAANDPALVHENYRRFLSWVDSTLDPAARERGVSSCEMCHRHLAELRPASFTT